MIVVVLMEVIVSAGRGGDGGGGGGGGHIKFEVLHFIFVAPSVLEFMFVYIVLGLLPSRLSVAKHGWCGRSANLSINSTCSFSRSLSL